MAHNIQIRDSQHGLEQAWHKLTKIPASGILTMDEVFPYKFETKPLFFHDGKTFTPHIITDDVEMSKDDRKAKAWSLVKCSDDNLPVGNGQPVNPQTYTVRTPQEDWQMIESMMSGTGHTVVSAGTVANRSKYFITIKLDGLEPFNVGARIFNQFLNILGSLDRSIPQIYNQSAICTVCENTVMANVFADVVFKVRYRHSKNMKTMIEGKSDDDKESFKYTLEQMFGVTAIFKAAMEQAASTPCNSDRAERIFTGFLTPLTDDKVSTRTKNTVENLVWLQANGLGNRGETMLDTLSAVTEYETRGVDGIPTRQISGNIKSDSNPWKQFVRSEFGLGSNRKVAFAQLVTGRQSDKDLNLADTEARGEKLLLASN